LLMEKLVSILLLIFFSYWYLWKKNIQSGSSHCVCSGSSYTAYLFITQSTDSEKARFMIFERGPRAFIDETVKLLCGLTVQGSSTQNLSQSASDYIGERVGFLSSLRYSLATLLAQVCCVQVGFFLVFESRLVFHD